jgi:signal peptidase II
MPSFGGQSFTFFSPIFNIADSCITVGLGILIYFLNKVEL